MHPVKDAAVLAIVYREHYKAVHTCADDVLDDFEACRGELSLATLIGSHALTDLDWQIMRTLDHPDSVLSLARALSGYDALRAEALMHACPPNGRRSTRRWAEAYTARWQDVERAIRERCERTDSRPRATTSRRCSSRVLRRHRQHARGLHGRVRGHAVQRWLTTRPASVRVVSSRSRSHA